MRQAIDETRPRRIPRDPSIDYRCNRPSVLASSQGPDAG